MAVTLRKWAHGSRRADDRATPRSRSRRRRRGGREVEISLNLAPMIDVTFLLLIFFLVTTTFERAEGVFASKLPRDTGVPAIALPISPIVVRLSRTGPDHDDFAIRLDKLSNHPATFGALTDLLLELQRKPGFDDETPLVIVAQNDVPWDHVVGCWNAALRAGCKRIAFAEP